MRVSVLILVLSLGSLVGWSRVASADKVKTNQSTKVYSRPGEHGKVLLKLASGQNMTVLAREGRWLKVRVRGMTGYVPRSKVDEPDEGELVRNTRRRPFVDGRGTKRGFGGQGGPDDRVGADATVDRSDDGAGSDDGGDQGSASKGDKDDGDGDSDGDDSDRSAKPKAQAKARGHAKHDSDSDSADSDSDDTDSGDSSDSDSSDSSDDDGGGKAKASSKHKGSDDGDSDSDGDDAEPDDSKTGDPDEDKRPKAHVVAKTVAYEERSADSDANFTAKPDMVLYPSDKKGKWTFVEDDEGDAGWVLTSKLEMDGGSDDGSSDDGGDGSARARTLDAGAGLGVTILQQALHTAGAPAPMQGTLNIDNYSIGTPAVSLALGGEALYPYSKRWMLGGAATLDYSKTLLGGISFPSSTASTGVSFMVFNLRAEAGYDLHKKNGMMVFGRLGYRYQSFAVDDYSNFMKNPAKLPQETLGAPTLGAALAIPKLTDKIGLSFSLDAILAGASIQQTKGLEDGASPSAKVFLVGGVFTYRWKKDMNLVGTYTLDYASIDFGKPVATSMRAHMGSDVTRTDLNHFVTFGFTKGF